MANDEHVALLRQGAATWNEWRRSNLPVKPNLNGARLSDVDLRGADLSRADCSSADLCRADLREANFFQAILRLAKLQGARLNGAYLLGADLSHADLSRADLTGANFIWAKLNGANLRQVMFAQTNLTGALLSAADLSGAFLYEAIIANVNFNETIGLDECKHLGPSIVDFRTISRSTKLTNSFLRGCGLPDNLIEYAPSLRGEAIRFYSCFISYSAKDQLFADRLYADLQNKGVRCYFAPDDLPVGAKTLDAIDTEIHITDKLLVILSKAAIDSDWVEDEVEKAYAEERSRKQVVLFPIRIDNAVISTAEPWAVKLRDQRNIGDFRQWKRPERYQKSLERLLRDLKPSETK